MMDKWINNNTISKILALAVAILLWGMVHLDTGTPSSTLTVSYNNKVIDNVGIQASGLDDSKYVLSTMDTDHVKMEVRGQRSVLTSFFADNYQAKLNLNGLGAGTKTLSLEPDLPDGVELVSMTPNRVTVTIEEKQTKSFNVSIVPKGNPDGGLQLGKPVIAPQTVKVTLPKSQLSTVTAVQGAVNTDGISEKFEQKRVKLKAYNKKGQELTGAVIEPSTVSVEIPVTQQAKSVPVKIVYAGELPDGLALSKVNANVKEAAVYASQDILSSLSSYVTATLDLSQFTEAGTRTVQANLAAPSGSDKIEPGSIQIQVTVVPSNEVTDTERTLSGIPIVLQGAGDGATVTAPVGKTMDVTVKGPQDMVNNLTNDDISLVADVSGLAAGQHEVTLKVGLPKYITQSGNAGQLKVTVNIESPSTPAVTNPNSENEPNPSGSGEKGQERPQEGQGSQGGDSDAKTGDNAAAEDKTNPHNGADSSANGTSENSQP
ncbi:CdaR family protein [Paenibacillus sp. LX16]|uniref:CdaR family protein n=1 Tax=Paenibacillus sp. LX16 TaxID=1740264 RepID=UPI002E291EA4|nr:CdaR family protein [Paenibacillus sp. LX16]